MGSRTLALGLAVAGCLSKPPRPGDQCGNARVDAEERCDDGNLDGEDGCSASCEIEPWFSCPTAGEPCHPVLALQWTAPGARLPPLGGVGGTEFERPCDALAGVAGPNTVIVGLQGETEASAMASLVGFSALCADVELATDGTIAWTPAPKITTPEGTSPAGGLGLDVRSCAPDEVVTGFDGNSSDLLLSGVEVICQAITHADGKLRFGTPRKLPLLGPGNQFPQPTSACPEGHVARAIAGRAGAIIDQFTILCVPTELVSCGDGTTNPDFETCDDGNAIPGDGCNATCSGP